MTKLAEATIVVEHWRISPVGSDGTGFRLVHHRHRWFDNATYAEVTGQTVPVGVPFESSWAYEREDSSGRWHIESRCDLPTEDELRRWLSTLDGQVYWSRREALEVGVKRLVALQDRLGEQYEQCTSSLALWRRELAGL